MVSQGIVKVAAATILDPNTISDWSKSKYQWAAGLTLAAELVFWVQLYSYLSLSASLGFTGDLYENTFGPTPIPMEDENAGLYAAVTGTMSAFGSGLFSYLGITSAAAAAATAATAVGAKVATGATLAVATATTPVAVTGAGLTAIGVGIAALGSIAVNTISNTAALTQRNKMRQYEMDVARKARNTNIAIAVGEIAVSGVVSVFKNYILGYHRNLLNIMMYGREESQAQQMYDKSLKPDDSQVRVTFSAQQQAELPENARRARNTARELESAKQNDAKLQDLLPKLPEIIQQIVAEVPIDPIPTKRTFWSVISDLTNFTRDASQFIGGTPLDLYDDDELLGSARRIGRMNLSLDQKTDYLIKLYKGDHNKAARAMARLNLV
jgi:hypothetical protein